MNHSFRGSVWLIVAALFACAGALLAAEKTIRLPPDNPMAQLKPGPGVDVVRAKCELCHSADYIVRQPGGDAKHWEPEVKKMVAVYGLPLSDEELKAIVNYLGTAYPAGGGRGESEKAGVRTRQK